VRVLSATDYAAWVDTEKKKQAAKADDPAKVWALDDLSKRGEKVYAANCAACHQASGKGVKGAFPALAGTPLVQGDAKPLLAVVLNGKNEMPGFKDDLGDADLAGLLTYVRTSWGNKGKPVAPADVAAARRKK
jgi:cytochrome c oxidase subunit 2